MKYPDPLDRPYGLAMGRFQPLHNQHVEYLLAAARRCSHLIVGITDPDRSHPFATVNAEHRSNIAHNPFSYLTRARMINATLRAEGLEADTWTVVPSPWPGDAMLQYLPPIRQVECFVTILDAWSIERMEMLKTAGFDVTILWDKRAGLLRGTEVRSVMRQKGNLSQLVPAAVMDIIEAHHGSEGLA